MADSHKCYNESQFTAAVLPLLQNCDETSKNVTNQPNHPAQTIDTIEKLRVLVAINPKKYNE
jgi:hypothetical protein